LVEFAAQIIMNSEFAAQHRPPEPGVSTSSFILLATTTSFACHAMARAAASLSQRAGPVGSEDPASKAPAAFIDRGRERERESGLADLDRRNPIKRLAGTEGPDGI
jgi:hypothetical protein